MALNPIPPQAYTKDTLQRAYSWLLSQGPEIKEMASTQDILVSLYLQTTRNGVESLERPSIQNFRTELKTLADQLGNFETTKKSNSASSKGAKPTAPNAPRGSDYVTEPKAPVAKTTSAYSTEMPEIPPGITPEQLKQALAAVYESTLASSSNTSTAAHAMSREQYSAPPIKQGTAVSEKTIEDSAFKTPTSTAVTAPSVPTNHEVAGLDAESLRKITEIQSILNLSTHHEAIRALIAIGYKKLISGLE